MIVFALLLIVLGAFSLHVYRSEKRLQPKTDDRNEKKTKEQQGEVEKYIPKEVPDEEDIEQDSNNQDGKDEEKELSAHQRYQKQALELVLTKSAIFQSSLYIIAFLFVYSGPFIIITSDFTHSEMSFGGLLSFTQSEVRNNSNSLFLCACINDIHLTKILFLYIRPSQHDYLYSTKGTSSMKSDTRNSKVYSFLDSSHIGRRNSKCHGFVIFVSQ